MKRAKQAKGKDAIDRALALARRNEKKERNAHEATRLIQKEIDFALGTIRGRKLRAEAARELIQYLEHFYLGEP